MSKPYIAVTSEALWAQVCEPHLSRVAAPGKCTSAVFPVHVFSLTFMSNISILFSQFIQIMIKRDFEKFQQSCHSFHQWH